MEGTDAKVECNVEANPSKVEYRWFRGGKEVPGATAPTLPLGVLSRKDHGKSIACEAKNAIGVIRNSQLLSIKCSSSIFTCYTLIDIMISFLALFYEIIYLCNYNTRIF